jgi:hypothetical protein
MKEQEPNLNNYHENELEFIFPLSINNEKTYDL